MATPVILENPGDEQPARVRSDGIKFEKVSRHRWLTFGATNDHELARMRPAVSCRIGFFSRDRNRRKRHVP